SLGEIGAAESIEAAIGAALDAGHGTPDVGRDDGTAALTAAIVAGLPVAVPPLGAASGAPA
ncbi:MAG: hypothetical protein ACXWOW_08525, partial [Candidatus Limnocylindrales bacterium]